MALRGREARQGTVRASLLVIVTTGSGSVANFLFQWIAARNLTADAFSLLAALLAVITISILPGPPLSLAIVRRLARRDPDAPSPSLAHARTVGLTIGALLFAAVLGAGSLTAHDPLHLSGRGGGALWGAAAAASLAWLWIFPDLARLQAAGRFTAYGRAHALLSALRLGLGGGVLLAGAGPGIAIAMLAIGPVLVRLGLPRVPGEATPLRGRWLPTVLPTLAATGGLSTLVVLDVIFARARFGESDPEAAGGYAASATLARALFHIPFAATAVTVQRTAHAAASGLPHRRILTTNLWIVGLLVAIGGAILAAFPRTALALFAGEQRYESAAPLLVALLVPMACASIAAVPAHYLLALGRRSPVVILGSAPFALAALLARPVETPADLIVPLTWVQGIVAVLLLAAAFRVGGGRSASSPA